MSCCEGRERDERGALFFVTFMIVLFFDDFRIETSEFCASPIDRVNLTVKTITGREVTFFPINILMTG